MKKFIERTGNSPIRAMLSRLMTNLSAHSSPALRGVKLRMWIAALMAAFLAVNVAAFAPNAGASDGDPSTAQATGSEASADPSDRAGRVEQVVDGAATGIRLIEVRLGPDRVAERRSDLDTDAGTRDFGLDTGALRLVSKSVPAGSDREGISPLYHLHAALLI